MEIMEYSSAISKKDFEDVIKLLDSQPPPDPPVFFMSRGAMRSFNWLMNPDRPVILPYGTLKRITFAAAPMKLYIDESGNVFELVLHRNEKKAVRRFCYFTTPE